MAPIGGETTASPSSFSSGAGGVGMTGGGIRPGVTIRTLITGTTNRFTVTTAFRRIRSWPAFRLHCSRAGYYTYAVDGKMGPLTRAAIARYQRDHLLPITSGVDPATLG